MGQTDMKGFLRIAAVTATVLTLGGCAAWEGDAALPAPAGFVAAAPAAPQAEFTAVGRAVPSAAAAVVASFTPRKVTHIVRTAPVLRGFAGSTCPYTQTAQARAAAAARPLEHRRVYRFTAY